jgi:hypothetical protein
VGRGTQHSQRVRPSAQFAKPAARTILRWGFEGVSGECFIQRVKIVSDTYYIAAESIPQNTRNPLMRSRGGGSDWRASTDCHGYCQSSW